MSISQPQNDNPFPGLRPFRSDEHHLFFGREQQTAALLQLLRENRFLAVVGTSGSGKSSLVRAGMISELHGGTMTQAGSTWEVMILRPGGSPIENLARAMVEADLYDAEDPNTLPRLKATLSRSRFGLVEAMKQSDVFEPGTNLLVVVDQFEELFRFRQQGVDSEDAATAFVNLLLTASAQAECPIYVTITMRSDFLGDCSEIPGLAEAVNEGEYLIPRLMRDQKRDAIEKPIGVGGAKISPLLVQRLLNDVGDDPDQLPVLQHALMRMWDVWSAGSDPDRPIQSSDFDQTGGLAAALSNHADEIYDSLPDESHRIACEKIFKTLTEKGDDNRGIRRPTRLAAIQAIAGADRQTVISVLDAFRASGVTFLMPGMETELSDRTVIDLSHESLMRGWQRLRTWVEEEAQSARIFRRVLDTARLWSDGKAGLFRDPDLQIATSWREEEAPNAQWAQQYGGNFETGIHFLETSNAEVQAGRQAEEAARRRELEQAQRLAETERQRAAEQGRSAVRLRWMVRGLGLVVLVAVTATVFAWFARQEARQSAASALQAQQQTQEALTEVEEKRVLAEAAEAAAVTAQQNSERAEKRSQEFRYATDMQLAAIQVNDKSANAEQILGRLNDHDPDQDSDLRDRDDLRGFEWHYLKRLVDDQSTIFDGVEKEVVAAALNAKGELVTLDADSRLQHWNVETREETQPALDLTKGRSVTNRALSRDGERVALGVGGKVYLVDATTGEEKARSIPAQTREGLLFSPDGNMMITADTEVAWWDANTGTPIARQDFGLAVSERGERDTVVSADGLTVAVAGQGSYHARFSVFKMNPESHAVTRLIDKAGRGIRTLAISPDGKTVVISQYFDGSLYVYDAVSGKLIDRLESAHGAAISSIQFNDSGSQLLTAALDGSVKVWHDATDLGSSETTALVGHSGEVELASFADDGRRVISADGGNSLRLWRLDRDSSSLHETIPGTNAYRVRYSPDGTLMAVSNEARLHLRDAVTGKVIARLPKRREGLISYSVAFSPDNRLLAAGFGGADDRSFIELWDIDRRERLAVLPGSTDIPDFRTTAISGTVAGLTFSPDGKHLVASFGSLGMIGGGDVDSFPLLVYDVATRRVIRRLEGPRNGSLSVTFSKDGSRLASGCYDGTARIWDTTTWRELHVLSNPDTASDKGYRRVMDVAFSPDGERLAMASAESNIIIWDVVSGRYLQTLRGHSDEVWSVAFSPNGHSLASGSMDGTVRLWNTATWRELLRIEPKPVIDPLDLTFSPDGTRLLAANRKGDAHVWSVQPATERDNATLKALTSLLEPDLDFQQRIRLQSENPVLHEALDQLAQQQPDNTLVQAALAASNANWHAKREEWAQSVEQFDRLKEIRPDSPGDWLLTPGLLRLATALLDQDRPVDAARLLVGGEKRRGDDGNATRSTTLGNVYLPGEYPLKLTQVYRGSPAWQAGLRAGDSILKFNDVELTGATHADFGKQIGGGKTIALTVRHAGQEQTETIELAAASHIQDDMTVELIETLQAAVDEKLAQSPSDAGLLELRAELAAQSSDYEQQVADYTAAIAALAEATGDETVADLARLHRRRGNAYVALNQWQLAVDDYAQGIADETTDEDLLANQALAQTRVQLNKLAYWTTLEPVTMNSKGGATLALQDDGSILVGGDHPTGDTYTIIAPLPLKRITAVRLETLPHPSLPKGGSGRDANGYFRLTRFTVALTQTDRPTADPAQELQISEAVSSYDGRLGNSLESIEGAINDSSGGWGVWPQVAQPHQAIFKLGSRPEVPKDGVLVVRVQTDGDAPLGNFRLSVSDREEPLNARRGDLVAAMKASQITNPWEKLAYAYRRGNDLTAMDQLAEHHPQSARFIGDQFIQGDDKDWQRAVEIYSRGITPETTDEELLGQRATAYEQLQDWNAAAADWSRAARQNPDGAKLLAEFANRLVDARQMELAKTQQRRARERLEAVLQDDPGDASAIEALAALLLDISEQENEAIDWVALRPADLKTAGGTTLTRQDDDSLRVEREPNMLTLADPNNVLQAIRIEVSPDAVPTDKDGPPFTEYRILSTKLPAQGFRGQYVRIDLPGDVGEFFRMGDGNKVLNLAELQVFRGDENIALQKSARQSSNYLDRFASRAVDGNTSGEPADASISCTQPTTSRTQPWWEVDLGVETDFDGLVIWNRIGFGPRLRFYRIQVLDASRHVVYERMVEAAPRPSASITRQVQLSGDDTAAANGAGSWQLSFRDLHDSSLTPHFRISATDKQSAAVPAEAIDTQDWNWSVSDPSSVAPATGTNLIAHDDGSFTVESDDSLALPSMPDSVKALRIETAPADESDSKKAPQFNDYRIEALDARRSESGALLGRFVRIDLPGDNSQYPRTRPQEKTRPEQKVLYLAEVQVLQGDRNLALRQPARQSSDFDRIRLPAAKAVDGNTTGNESTNSYAHTAYGDAEPWWEVDLGSEQAIEKMVVWNRPESEAYLRMNHFRVQILDAGRNVVSAQVIDDAPAPSREIDCRSLLVAKVSEPNDDSQQWSLRLRGDDKRFRISSAQTLPSLEQQKAVADARTITPLVARLAAAYDLSGSVVSSADWSHRALDNTDTDSERKLVLTHLEDHPQPLAELLKRQPNDIGLQLALARCHVKAGQRKLNGERPDAALTDLLRARSIFTRLQEQSPEPAWTVLKRTAIESEGGSRLTLLPDGSILAGGENPDDDMYTVTTQSDLRPITAFRLEALPHPSLPGNGPGRSLAGGDWMGNFHVSEIRINAGETPVALTDIFVAHSETSNHQEIIDGVIDRHNRWANGAGRSGQPNTAVIVPKSPFAGTEPITFFISHATEASNHGLGRFRLSITDDPQAFLTAPLHFELQPAELATLEMSIGKALVQQGKHADAAVAFLQALDRTDAEDERKKLIEQFQEHQAVMAILAPQRPQNTSLQLAWGSSLVENGSKALAQGLGAKALSQLARAQEISIQLAAQHPITEWTVLEPSQIASKENADFTLQSDGSIFVGGINAPRDEYTLTAPLSKNSVAAIRLEILPDERLPNGGASRHRNGLPFVLTNIEAAIQVAGDDKFHPLTIGDAWADYENGLNSIQRTLDSNDETNWGIDSRAADPHVAILGIVPVEVDSESGSFLRIRMRFGTTGYPGRNLGRFRLLVTSDPKALDSAQLQQQLKESGLAGIPIALAKAHAVREKVDDAATSFSEAFAVATDPLSHAKILETAAAYDGVLDKLTLLRSGDSRYLGALARHHHSSGNVAAAQAAASTARTLYEKQLRADPTNITIATEIADLIFGVESVIWTVLKPVKWNSIGGADLQLEPDGSIFVSGNKPNLDTYELFGETTLDTINAMQLETLPDSRLPDGGSGRGTRGNFRVKEIRVLAVDEEGNRSAVAVAGSSSSSRNAFHIRNAFDGDESTWWAVHPQHKQLQWARFQFSSPIQVANSHRLVVQIDSGDINGGENGTLGRFRLSVSQRAEVAEFAGLVAGNRRSPWFRLGTAYHAMGEQGKALDMFARSIELAGTNQAKASMAQKAAAFEDLFAKLLERFPDDQALHFGQAKHLISQHMASSRFKAALEVLSGSLADDPDDVELLNQRAGAFMELADWQSADTDYARVIELETDDVRRNAAERTRAECLLRMGQFRPGAEVLLQQMLLLPQGNTQASRDAFASAALAGNLAVARMTAGRFFKQANTINDLDVASSDALVRLHTTLPGLVTEDNRQRLLQVTSNSPNRNLATANTAAIDYRSGDFEKAQALLDTPLQGYEFQSLAAMLLYDRGQTTPAAEFLGRAESWFERKSVEDPHSVIPTQVFWGVWARNRTVWREAARKLIGPRIVELDELLAEDGDNSPARLERARLLANAGLYREAQDDLEQLVDVNVDSVADHALHGRVLAGIRRDEEALIHLNQAIEAGSQDAAVFSARGVIRVRRGQPESAAADLQKSLDLAPTVRAAVWLADLLFTETEKATNGNGSDLPAVEIEHKRLTISKLIDPWGKLAAVYHIRGDQAELDTLLTTHPAAIRWLGDLHAADGNWEQALAAYNASITPETTDARLLVRRGEAYMAAGQGEKAKADWLRAVELQPNLAATEFERHRVARRWKEAAAFGSLFMNQEPTDTLLWLKLAPVVVLAEDDEAYRSFCRKIVENYRTDPYPGAAERAIKACLLRPEAIDPAELPHDLLSKSLDDETLGAEGRQWHRSGHALFIYRNGDAESAIELVTQEEQFNFIGGLQALNRCILALAHHQLNHHDEAQKALDAAAQVIESQQAVDKNHHDLLIAEILYREAEAKINADAIEKGKQGER